jgi:hypothetical protein
MARSRTRSIQLLMDLPSRSAARSTAAFKDGRTRILSSADRISSAIAFQPACGTVVTHLGDIPQSGSISLTMAAVVLYLALCWSAHDAGQHQIIVQHLMLSARECSAEIHIYKNKHPQDQRSCACVPVQQVDITPHD